MFANVKILEVKLGEKAAQATSLRKLQPAAIGYGDKNVSGQANE